MDEKHNILTTLGVMATALITFIFAKDVPFTIFIILVFMIGIMFFCLSEIISKTPYLQYFSIKIAGEEVYLKLFKDIEKIW